MSTTRLLWAIVGSFGYDRTIYQQLVSEGLVLYDGGFNDRYVWDVSAVEKLTDFEKEMLLRRLERAAEEQWPQP